MSYDTTAPIPGWPPQPMPPRPAGWRRTPLWALITGGLALAGLIVGLVIWQPWNPPPNAPAAVSARSATATTADVSWAQSAGGATPVKYVIYRDGKQAGTVAASQLSWTDSGLLPGSKHRYTVVAVGGGQRSGHSTQATVTTLAPPPVKVGVTKATWTTITVGWRPSPQGPVPSQYTVYNGTTKVASLPGTTDSYRMAGLTSGTAYQVSVTARWGNATSAPCPAIAALTLEPPLSGSVPLTLKVTSTPGAATGLSAGQHWTDSWQFTANCKSTGCTLATSADLGRSKQFTVAMTRSGGGYSGSTTARLFTCDGVAVPNTITLRIYPKSGAVRNGGWTSWNGTMVLTLPYVSVSASYYCPTQSWDFALAGTGS
jgi:hypothetical protein